MNAIVSLLDAEHDAHVNALWDEIARDFGVRNVRNLVPYPHVTYQGAERYDLDRLDATLDHVARQSAPFTVVTTGITIFTGPQPVLAVSVARSRELAAFHRHLWEVVGDAGSDFSQYYHPDGPWMPHITLAQGDLDAETLAGIAGRLGERSFEWRIRLDNLAILVPRSEGEGHTLHRRFGFAGSARAGSTAS